VDEIAATIATAAVLFAVTNIDFAVVLTVLTVAARGAGALRPWQIWVGQYTAMAAMVLPALAAAAGSRVVSRRGGSPPWG
jgi:cadmium resistance protein CadD (predicted permease)